MSSGIFFELSSKMLKVKCIHRRYYPISTGNSRQGHNGKSRADEIREDFFIVILNLFTM